MQAENLDPRGLAVRHVHEGSLREPLPLTGSVPPVPLVPALPPEPSSMSGSRPLEIERLANDAFVRPR
jgi:hypothetical protein